MFRVIGGIVVYGFALYGAAALVSRLKVKKVVKRESDAAMDGPGGRAHDLIRQPEEGQTGVEVDA
jgi:hypothetical protein